MFPVPCSVGRETFWPNGTLAETPPPRDENTKLRTRVVCKAKLLGTVSGETTSNGQLAISVPRCNFRLPTAVRCFFLLLSPSGFWEFVVLPTLFLDAKLKHYNLD